nr:DUF4328 domain-containing protein [Streptomyces coryli]
MLIVGAVVDLVSLAIGVHMRDLLDRIMTASDSEIDRADTLYGLAGIVQTICFLAIATVFIVWFHRARKNAELFDVGQLRSSAGWAIGSWFIPIGNLAGGARQAWGRSRRGG